jgi:hypothetical protein
MWHLSYRPEVEDDIVNGVTWYDDKRSGLGYEFLLEYLAAIQLIRDNPLLFAVAATGLPPYRLKRFAYIVHFNVDDDNILVVALMGGGRDDSAFAH